MILTIRKNYYYTLKNCETLFENFSGRGTRYNNEGDRNFNVRINDPQIAKELLNAGYNVKLLKKLDDDDPDVWSMKINIGYKPLKDPTSSKNEDDPVIEQVIDGVSAELTRFNVHCLDEMDISNAVVSFHPYYRDKNDRSHCTAWLDKAVFVVNDDFNTDNFTSTPLERSKNCLKNLREELNLLGLFKDPEVVAAFNKLCNTVDPLPDTEDIPF